ncbi:alpha/beta hydrolase fold [Nocardioides scoriae]|uniref:Alpha/beta hydrolase fold n=1 Tax=Nocardioides scoriae TaxID=642780 RepID=A0A1H1LUH3_9ACTN|nr:alpha/beta fold hydrolase [Nocardioides scoriae]SDR78176.1 alpha/beta hydrolase fold [Nocardioides scoriae]
MTSSRTSRGGLALVDHRLTVPLDHDDPGGEQLEVFAREVTAPGGEDRPWLVFLQGGPGHEAPRPTGHPLAPAWIGRALRDFRVLLLDQRGTGLSTPWGAPRGATLDPEREAARLVHHRADAIVRDAEALREHLGVRRWAVLGQSFGGFCVLHYRSRFPDSLTETFFTGGLPPLATPVADVYAATYATVRRLDAAHHRRFPEDAARLRAVLDLAAAGELVRPDGSALTPRLVRTVGNQLGLDGDEALHHLLERDPLSPAFVPDLEAMLPFTGRNPLYAVIHEACYADGGRTSWAAHRALPDDLADGSAVLTGEHLFPWHFEDEPGLRPYAATAALLAEHPWPRLYDEASLAAVDLPGAAIVYADDAFVDRELSEQTLAHLPGVRRWLTDEWPHNGLRLDGVRILDRLLTLARGPR